ncbi:MAG: 16S rRNA (adenine(1518)-N(6)/adenine(1519)-N(6))-dimethyltransferase RsmA [Verrucomicrobia bacterium]|nr:16S rRNA (adenine(1518)-N(6)/adenine(1519)-N(6))-dimethyltransferase RsmA [Verrucomicrobiota bacterium]
MIPLASSDGAPADLDVLRPSVVRQLLADSEFRPSKALGQSFLIDRNIRDLIVRAAAIAADDVVLEIGAGLGALTEVLLTQARIVIAVEKDSRLHGFLQERFAVQQNLRLMHADMLDVALPDLLCLPGCGGGIQRVVSNLPYSVGSRILVDLARAVDAPGLIVATVQKEVGARLVAGAGTSEYGMLSLWMQARYDVDIVHTVGPRCFYPEPEVKSAVVRLVRRVGDVRPPDSFYAQTRLAFAQRRKQLVNSLAGAGNNVDAIRAALGGIGVDGQVRPENLSAQQWRALVEALDGMRR